jgi:hypothetical protein
MSSRLAWNSRSFCFSLLSAGIPGVGLHLYVLVMGNHSWRMVSVLAVCPRERGKRSFHSWRLETLKGKAPQRI